MPLHDYFHEPLAPKRSWTAFTGSWATYIAEELNQQLPEGYFAEATAQFSIEIDVSTWEEPGGPPRQDPPPEPGWSPSAPQATLPLVLVTDVVEVRVTRYEGGPELAAALELVSPGNKDRPMARSAFVSKCASFLQQGVGLMVVDMLTNRHANLHGDLLARVSPEQAAGPEGALFAAAYRPFTRAGQPVLDVWHELLAIGSPMPTLPLWMRGGFYLPVNLEATYDRTFRNMRLGTNGA